MNAYFEKWISILGQERFSSIQAPVQVKTNFDEHEGLQTSIWFLKSAMDKELKGIQRFHFDQQNPESEPQRFNLHPDHGKRHFSHGAASTGFLQLQIALDEASTKEQIWGLMVYGTLFRHCLSQKSIGYHACDDLVKEAMRAVGDLMPAFDPKSHHVLPGADVEGVLHTLSSEDANIWIANTHCNLLDNYSLRTIQLTTTDTDLSKAVRLDIEADNARQAEWRNEHKSSNTDSLNPRGPQIR